MEVRARRSPARCRTLWLVFSRSSGLMFGMIPRLILSSVIAVLLTGCGRRPETAPSGPASGAEPAQSAAGVPATEPPRLAEGSEPADSDTTLDALPQALRKRK